MLPSISVKTPVCTKAGAEKSSACFKWCKTTWETPLEWHTGKAEHSLGGNCFPAPLPCAAPRKLQATAQPRRRRRLWREGCSVGSRAAFPCPHPQVAARAGGRPAGLAGQPPSRPLRFGQRSPCLTPPGTLTFLGTQPQPQTRELSGAQ